MTGVPGLGTSTSKEAKEYFSEMERHRIMFRYGGTEDDSAITLVSSVSMETAARCLDQLDLLIWSRSNVAKLCEWLKELTLKWII